MFLWVINAMDIIQSFLRFGCWGAIATAVSTVSMVAPVLTGVAMANASLFGVRDLNAGDVVAIAVPIDKGEAYNLLILEQIGSSRDCWREDGNVPTVVDPLLLNFDFTNICGRSTDSNGYSLRLAGEEMAWRYDLRLVREGTEIKLKAFNTENTWRSPIEVGSTRGMAQGMLKIHLNGGWRMAKRTYEGKTLGHIYIVNDQSVNQLIANLPSEETTPLTTSSLDRIVETVDQPPLGSDSVQVFVAPSYGESKPVSGVAVPMPPTPVRDVDSLSVLPVPNQPIPSNASSSSGRAALHTLETQPPPPPSSVSLAMSLGLKYRVVVDARTSQQTDQIKSIVPDAFNTWVGDRRMLQVGAYSNEIEAQEMQAKLSQSGFAAQILPVR